MTPMKASRHPPCFQNAFKKASALVFFGHDSHDSRIPKSPGKTLEFDGILVSILQLRKASERLRNENDTRKDLVEVFQRFAAQLRLHREQALRQGCLQKCLKMKG